MQKIFLLVFNLYFCVIESEIENGTGNPLIIRFRLLEDGLNE